MQKKTTFITLILTGTLLVLATGLWLATARPVAAQCGSQASSCKDCHEVQAQLSVNADGTSWHQAHAFGDFCYICHGGNTQSTDKAAAHTGMVPPLEDVKASCQQCHPKDLEARAKVYFDTLGIAPGEASAEKPAEAAPQAACPSPEPTAFPEPANNLPADTTLVVAKPARTVDYIARYNENVLGIRTVNWGLIGLVTLSVAVVVGGAGFLAQKKGWVAVTFEKVAQVAVPEASQKAEVAQTEPKDEPSEASNEEPRA
jgi:hypothetical protein